MRALASSIARVALRQRSPASRAAVVPAALRRAQCASSAAVDAAELLPVQLPEACPGCGVRLQTADPDRPG